MRGSIIAIIGFVVAWIAIHDLLHAPNVFKSIWPFHRKIKTIPDIKPKPQGPYR